MAAVTEPKLIAGNANLPLAKSIIEGQNGVISVQSEVGKGTLFTLSFLTDL